MQKVIDLKNISRSFHKTKAVSGVNLSVNQGEIYGFLGPNGAGKTTTIRMMLGQIKPDSGAVSILGMDPQQDAAKIMQETGFIPGDFVTYEEYRVRDLLEYFEKLSGKDTNKKRSVIKRLELNENEFIKNLSKGNRQKVALVLAFMIPRKLLILDEPSSGLDPLMQQEFNQLCLEFKHEGGTIFISSHILSEVEKMCDRLAIIKKGEIVAEETINELRAKSGYKVSLCLSSLSEATKLSEFSSDLKSKEITFNYNGDINKLLKALAQIRLTELTITELSLEDLFYHYYQD